MIRIILSIVLLSMLSACAGMQDRLENIGKPPALSQIDNPIHRPDYRPVNIPIAGNNGTKEPRHANSLWQAGSKSFFKDQRASEVGDLITILIDIADDAQLSNTTSRSRSNTENAGIASVLGFERQLQRILPTDGDPANLAGVTSDLNVEGAGAINRREKVNLRVAGLVTQKLPNGNMVLHGRQEVRVNFEVRELQVAGIIRPEDITVDNTISYEKIAEARISYGGRGHISDVQQPRYGSQVLDIILPF